MNARALKQPAPGLRLQILFALALLLALAFVPLFFAVASLARVTIATERGAQARLVAQWVVSDVLSREVANRDSLEGIFAAFPPDARVEAVCVRRSNANELLCTGEAGPRDAIAIEIQKASLAGPRFADRGDRGVIFVRESGELRAAARVRLDDRTDAGAPLVRLVALYTAVFALALLVFAYIALTRIIVGPVERLARATNRVAKGARELVVPPMGARELGDLAASVQSMTDSLVQEEEALRAKVQELTDTAKRLTDTQAQLVRSERMASVGRLAAGLAHEVGNPLAALLGFEELLLGSDLSASERDDFVRRMKGETERIHRVIRDLLDFARPEQPASGTTRGVSDVAQVTDDVLRLLKPQKEFKEIHVVTELPSQSCRVLLGPDHLTQVLLNLLLNAVAALKDHEAARITIRAEIIGNKLRVDVEDNGSGVDPNLAERIFEPFVTTKSVGEGSGLGLAVCRGLIESAGGEIGVDTSFREGARLYFVLPLA